VWEVLLGPADGTPIVQLPSSRVSDAVDVLDLAILDSGGNSDDDDGSGTSKRPNAPRAWDDLNTQFGTVDIAVSTLDTITQAISITGEPTADASLSLIANVYLYDGYYRGRPVYKSDLATYLDDAGGIVSPPMYISWTEYTDDQNVEQQFWELTPMAPPRVNWNGGADGGADGDDAYGTDDDNTNDRFDEDASNANRLGMIRDNAVSPDQWTLLSVLALKKQGGAGASSLTSTIYFPILDSVTHITFGVLFF
jgi:hypothetical protein